MSYSCSDFYDDVMRCLADCGATPDADIAGNDVGAAADLALAAIVTMHRASLSSLFVRELLGEVESLGAVAGRYGTGALPFLFYLQAAILNGSFVDARSRDDAELLALIARLPSAGKWMKNIRVSDCG